MDDQLTLRSARLDDAAAIAALSAVLGYPVAADSLAERLARLTAGDADVVFVVDAGQGRIAGWMHAELREALEAPMWCEILGLVVDAEYRRDGVGARLVAAAEDWAHERGITMLKVRSNAARTESHPFYERVGFERFKSQHVYRKRVDGARGAPDQSAGD